MPDLTIEEIAELERIKEKRRYFSRIADIIDDANPHIEEPVDPEGETPEHGNQIIQRVIEQYKD